MAREETLRPGQAPPKATNQLSTASSNQAPFKTNPYQATYCENIGYFWIKLSIQRMIIVQPYIQE
ncbi:hypothetical protein PGT21_019309 [Puccinia graminis f. sp. tritici]|uniref:Uncharacterized protein n=1 Tax=Puccinia graminis f. sp. tritici TaxID=56615 RepID=A0A5B0MKK4_PUCGR|nr:hypothetical protein PGT21_019309 [Puccinia graminis f. sp. tritici]